MSATVHRFDKEVADLMQEMKKGGVMEVRKKPIPPLSALSTIDSQQWQGLNVSFLHSHYPGESLVFLTSCKTYFIVASNRVSVGSVTCNLRIEVLQQTNLQIKRYVTQALIQGQFLPCDAMYPRY